MFFRHTQGGDVANHALESDDKLGACTAFESFLKVASDAKLEKRLDIEEQRYSFIKKESFRTKPHTIYRFPVTQLNNQIRVIVFRREGAKYSEVAYAFIDEIANYYQVVSVEQLVEELDRANWLSSARKDVSRLTKTFTYARKRPTPETRK